MKNGKIFEFIKSHWRTLLYGLALLVGVFCGVWACSKSTPFDVDANRNRIIINLSDATSKKIV